MSGRALAIALALSPLLAAAQTVPAPPATALPAVGERTEVDETPARRATAAFRRLDNVEGAHVDLLFNPVRPMLQTVAGEIWAVNTHDSTLQHFVDASGQPLRTIRVPWGPVSVAYWVPPAGNEEVLVVCRGNHVLARVDVATGRVSGIVPLGFEPGDILVDAGEHRAFVSCPGEDRVLLIDLLTGETRDTFDVPSKHPLFLSWEGSNVLVAPMISGNDSLIVRGGLPVEGGPPTGILDTADPEIALVGLPDEDLFRLTPGATPGTGTVEVAARALGTILFQHALNPATGELWVLNTEALNKDPERQSEPALRGDFVRNRVTITTLGPPGAAPVETHGFGALDDLDGVAPHRSVGQPYGLTFADDGRALVVGMLTDNVSVLDTAGALLEQWDVPTGSIPRAVLLDPTGTLAHVYCWGTNRIETYAWQQPGTPHVLTRDLGFDPTPPTRQEGRELFYDGHNSLHRNASCATCHIDAQWDGVPWNLSDLPYDDKGPLVTQNLRGIEALLPYHWRGERTMLDFNVAFPRLMGGIPLDPSPGGDFARFQEYLFSLANPANRFADRRRIVSDALPFDPPGSEGLAELASRSAVRGQQLFFERPAIGTATCDDCHALPTGTNNDTFIDAFRDTGHRNNLKVVPFSGMERKDQPTRTEVVLADGRRDVRSTLGSSHISTGEVPGLLEFITGAFSALTLQERVDVATFVHQIDTGLAPAVHEAVLLQQQRADSTEAWLAAYLLAQADARNCDVAVFGRVELGGRPADLAWAYDRVAGTFVPSDSTVGPRTPSFFADQARAGTGSNVFLGLPVGMARRFAVDADEDGLPDLDELNLATDPRVPDSDGDGFHDGHEVDHGSDPTQAGSVPVDGTLPVVSHLRVAWVTTRVAKIQFDTDEPATFRIDYGSTDVPGGFVGSVEGQRLATNHTAVLRDLVPGYETDGQEFTYEGRLTVTDRGGNAVSVLLPAFRSRSFITGGEEIVPTETVVGDLQLLSVGTAPGGGYELVWQARADHKKKNPSTPVEEHVVVGRVIVDGQLAQTTDLLVDGAPPPELMRFGAIFYQAEGPFLVGSVTGPDGLSTLTVELPTAQPGDVVELSIETIGQVDSRTFDPTGLPELTSTSTFSLPDTPTSSRRSLPVLLP